MWTLTKQELRIAKLIAQSQSRKAIESQLVIAPGTLRVHLGNICKKLELASFNPYKMGHALTLYNRWRAASDRTKRGELTPSEREVLEMRVASKVFWQIAQARGCAVSTVLCISSTGCRKLGIRKSTNPVTLAAALAKFDAGAVGPVNPMDDPAFQ